MTELGGPFPRIQDEALDIGARIWGIVTNANTGEPVQNALVTILDASFFCMTSGYTNASGAYSTFAALPAGTYYVSASGTGFFDQRHDGHDCLPYCFDLLPSADPIVASGTDVSGIDFELTPASMSTAISNNPAAGHL